MKSRLLLLLSTASLSLQAPVEGTNSISHSTVSTRAEQSFFTKNGVTDCAIEGSAGPNTTSRYFTPQNVPDVLACQNQCLYYGGCVMYSWAPTASPPDQCIMYTAVGDEVVGTTAFTDSVIRGSTGVFWSDRTLRDGSHVCYSAIPFTAAGTISSRTEEVVENLSSTVTAPPAIITNSNVANCHVEGLPGNITYYGIGQKHEKNPLLCEEACLSNVKCRSYSYQEVPETNAYLNCHLYTVDFDTKINATPLVMASHVSGIFYSNRFFPNGTYYCYLPAGSSSLKARDEASTTVAPVPRTKNLLGCAIRGHAGRLSREVTSTSTFPSVFVCQSVCGMDNECKAYSFDFNNSTCTLYFQQCDQRTFGEPMVYEDPASTEYFANKLQTDGTTYCYLEPGPSKMMGYIEETPTTTTTSTPSATASNPAIQTKALATCNQQGMPTTILLTFMISSHYETNVLGCQSSCKAAEKCLSYSYREVTEANTGYPNCEFFSCKWDGQVNGTDLVIKSWRYGIYYSDRFPGDGSEECFVAVH